MVTHVSVGLLGLGTVGSGVVRMIEGNREELQHRVGCPVFIEKILVQNVEKERLVSINNEWLTQHPEDVLQNPNIHVVIEVMGVSS